MHRQKADSMETMEIKRPDQLLSYFRRELVPLFIVFLTGMIYNIGLTATPFFEGQLVQRLYDIIKGEKTIGTMFFLATLYIVIILFVQGARALKRYYVRKFANNTSRNMRHMLYNQLVHSSKKELNEDTVGTLMTKAVADVDACVEGMRKFTTEVFDTGVALVSYLVMLFLYDWRLALLSSMFTLVAYVIAEKMKTVVYRYHTAYKKSAENLEDATMDRVENAITYRVFGQENARDLEYEKSLTDYEKKAVMANIWENTLRPIYYILSMTGVVSIIYFGAGNVMGTGWTTWDIAAFTTFLSCFTKMAQKSSRAAKLFNAVQKAQVSWKRIKPLMKAYVKVDEQTEKVFGQRITLTMDHITFSYEPGKTIIRDLSFHAEPGEVIGITGEVACGKSTLGKLFLGEEAYQGNILIGDRELRTFSDYERNQYISYMGHQPELMSDTLQENIAMGGKESVTSYLQAVCLEQEVDEMPEGSLTHMGSSGTRFSGGQQARVALARTLYHKRRVLVLDDPFSAVDQKTEQRIMAHLRQMNQDSILLLISHRVTLFPTFEQIIWMEKGRCYVGTHQDLIRDHENYAKIFHAQQAGGDLDEA
ncbi:MAG: ABC transporter ATP-binding protein [Lachnospiraceae bacterium]|nr:ABC transporter ATP-binding protein [Lachnospiraceae bacterium]